MGYSTRFDAAVAYANAIHAAQVRKSTTVPYLTHLLSVAALVGEHGGTEDQVIAGLLHDAAEDQGGQRRLDDVRQRFGDQVADIVAACSDSLTVDPAAKETWQVRKERYLAGFAKKPAAAFLVIAADKLHNLRAMRADLEVEGPSSFAKFKQGFAKQLWYHQEILAGLCRSDVFGEGRAQRLLWQFRQTLADLAQAGTARGLLDGSGGT